MVNVRLLVLASMVLVGGLQVSSAIGAQGSTPQKSREIMKLHATSKCVLCDTSISKETCWPEVVVIQCVGDDNENNQHLALVHTSCIQSRQETYECACKKKISQQSKECIKQAHAVKHDPNALKDSAHLRYQWYTAKMKARYEEAEHITAETNECSICRKQLTTWPDTIILHANHANRAAHAYHRKCIQDWKNSNNWHFTCPTCRADITPEKDAIENITDQAPYSVHDMQKYEPMDDELMELVKSGVSKKSAVVDAIKKYRLLRYPALCAAGALTLYGMYMYGNAESLSVSEATTGMWDATWTGGCVGFVAALAHYVRDWYVAK